MAMGSVIGFVVFFFCLQCAHASAGDRSQFFNNCMKGCLHSNCTAGAVFSYIDLFALEKINSKIFYLSFLDAIKFKETIKQDFFNEILLWTCHDECIYHCMWRTTNAFISRNWNVPQFYGKWPFKRFLGIQEPASVFFSFLNLLAHWRMIRKFRREVRNDSPMYYVWHIFNAVSKEYTCFLFETNLLAVLYINNNNNITTHRFA